jgi:hypothetical protein
MKTKYSTLVLGTVLMAAASDAGAWWTPIGSAHKAISDAALSDAQSAAFIAYLGLNPSEISDYSQQHEPWDGDWQTHTAFWSIITPDAGGWRYTNDLGYVGLSHNRDGGSWPGRDDRSVDVIGVVLHSAADCAVIMGHSPGNDWYTNSAYEAVFEGGGNNRSGTSWDPPALPFIDGAWERYVYTGAPVNEAHKLYLDTHDNFVWWDTNVPELQKAIGGSLLDDAAERAVKTGKRWSQAVLVDFLENWVLKPPSASISCNEIPGPDITVNSGSVLTFHYTAGGDRERLDITVSGETLSMGAADPMALDAEGDTPGIVIDDPGTTSVTIVAGHNFFGLAAAASDSFDINVVPRPAAALRLDADDDDGETIPDYDLLTETPPTIYEESTGYIAERVVKIRDGSGAVRGTFTNQPQIPWTIDEVGLYDITTTASNGFYGPSSDSMSVQLRVLSGFPEPTEEDTEAAESLSEHVPEAADAAEPGGDTRPSDDGDSDAGPEEEAATSGCGCMLSL